jgi:ABC-type glutathione transport system ATPase component
MADEKIIFSMNGVGKVLPHNNKVILKDIYLSFFYGAKIGIIGLNGSGKSTLLKIIAGVEKSYKGEVVWAPGYSVGYLEQEPQMDPSKTVLEVVQEGVQEVMDLLAEYNEISAAFMEPMDDDRMNALIERQGELTEQIEHVGGWRLIRNWNGRWMPFSARRRMHRSQPFRAVNDAGWPSAACCCVSPMSSCWTSPPTTWIPNPSSGWKPTCSSTKGR